MKLCDAPTLELTYPPGLPTSRRLLERASIGRTSLHGLLLASITACVFAMDLSEPGLHMSLGYLAVVMLSMRLPTPRAPLYASILAVALTQLAPLTSPWASEASLAAFDRALVSLALLASGVICHFRLQSRAALRAARVQTETFTGIASHVEAPVAILGMDGQIVFWNRAAERLYGFTASETLGKCGLDLYSPTARDLVREMIEKSVDTGAVETLETTRLDKRRKSITVQETLLPIFDESEQPLGVATIDDDQTSALENEHATHRLAYFDPLTSLPNRHLFQQELQEVMEASRRHSRLSALLFFDLDRFKHVNDAYGHPVGDRLLCLVAERLMGSVRRTDYVGRRTEPALDSVVSRLGGDEFTVILSDIASANDAALTAKRMLDSLKRPIALEDQEATITASVGIAIYPYDGGDPATLVRNADTAMYKAKTLGPGQCAFYSDEINRELKHKLAVASAMRRALEEDRFELHFQPQARIDEERFVGAEALLRLNDPELGVVSPGEFIPVAEENGLVTALGEWALRTACAKAAPWAAEGHDLRVAVNVSTHQLRIDDDSFLNLVTRTLEQSGLDPTRLELEITESALIGDSRRAIQILEALRSHGVHIVLDDFGTGYSSLGRLLRLPLDGIKTDRSFLEGINKSPRDEALVRAIIAMAKSLDLNIVAEGVEGYAQLEFLRAYACDEVQGYLLSRPVPETQLAQRLRQPVWPGA